METWAKHEKIWFNIDDIRQNWDRLDDGTSQEAEVYKFPETNTVRKVMKYDALDSSQTPMDFINDRISIHNYLFPQTKYKLLGFTKTRYEFRFVLEQQFISDLKEATKQEVEEFMSSIGFDNHEGTYYWNNWFIVGDLHSKNILKGKGNKFYIIDPVPRLNIPEDENGKAEYKPFKIINNHKQR